MKEPASVSARAVGRSGHALAGARSGQTIRDGKQGVHNHEYKANDSSTAPGKNATPKCNGGECNP